MKFIAFAGDYYNDNFTGGGWYGAIGGGDVLEELVQAGEAKAQELLDTCTAPSGQCVTAWYHVVDMDKLEIVKEVALHSYGGKSRTKAIH